MLESIRTECGQATAGLARPAFRFGHHSHYTEAVAAQAQITRCVPVRRTSLPSSFFRSAWIFISNLQGLSTKILPIERSDSRACLVPFHLNKSEALASTGKNIGDQTHRTHRSKFGKQCPHAVLGGLGRQIANKHFFQSASSLNDDIQQGVGQSDTKNPADTCGVPGLSEMNKEFTRL